MALQLDVQLEPGKEIRQDTVKIDCLRRRTILLVEDEPFVREATCAILEHAGYEVLSASDASCARQFYEEHERAIDLLLTDMILPGCSGPQLGQQLRQTSPKLMILVTSGYSNLELTHEAPQSRNYFLAKPYSRKSLLEKVEMILNPLALQRVATQAC